VSCAGNVETSTHLFLHCPSAILIWYEVFRWLCVVVVIPPNLFVLFESFRSTAKNARARNDYLMIWHATLWSIWKVRNNTIFLDGSFNPRAIVEDIKILSWKWSLACLKILPCLFYECTWDPGVCILRV
jgi:hypothetical protein